jgi:hypothetical protein
VQQQVLGGYVLKPRGRMHEVLESLRITPPAQVASRAAIDTALCSAGIMLEEGGPSRLRGYGSLGPEASAAVGRPARHRPVPDPDGWLHLWAGPEVSVSLLYVLPVAAVSWLGVSWMGAVKGDPGWRVTAA